MRAALALFLIASGQTSAESAENGGSAWHVVEPGLELGTFAAPTPAAAGDSLIRVLRIDPRRFELRLLNASAPNQGQRLTAREWSLRNDLVAAINASMYQSDYRTSVSLMTASRHTNNPRLSRDKAVLAFDRRDDTVPVAQIIDRQEQDFESLRARYATLVQSIRMVSLTGANVWSQQPTRWSTSAIGMDRRGRVLFIHVRSAYSTHDLINMLLALPIELRNAMYTEGGPEAQLYVRGGETEFEFIGAHDNPLLDANVNTGAWPVPNVVGVARITPPAQ